MSDTVQDMLSEAVANTETEIFQEAFQDEPAKDEPVQADAEETKAEERPRDEAGKFKAKAKEAPEAAEVKTEEAKPAEGKAEAEKTDDDDKGQVPSWRLREVADEKRALQAERDTLKSELAQMRAEIAGLKKPQEQPKQEDIDPFLDPQGFTKRIESSFERIESSFEARLREERLNNSLALAHVKYGEKFEKAYNAVLSAAQSGNHQIVPQLTSQPNPGEAFVKWFSDQETLREVGHDPAAYKNKILEDALNDQAFLAKVVEKIKGSSSNGQQRPNNVTQLPPSLSRATGTSKNDDPLETDNSDRAVFEYAFSR